MGVSNLNLNSAVMSVSRTSGMTGMKVSKPAPTTVTFVTVGPATGGTACVPVLLPLRVVRDVADAATAVVSFLLLVVTFSCYQQDVCPVVLDN